MPAETQTYMCVYTNLKSQGEVPVGEVVLFILAVVRYEANACSCVFP